MAWYSILPAELVDFESWIVRCFVCYPSLDLSLTLYINNVYYVDIPRPRDDCSLDRSPRLRYSVISLAAGDVLCARGWGTGEGDAAPSGAELE
jgi:hypothetical protein